MSTVWSFSWYENSLLLSNANSIFFTLSAVRKILQNILQKPRLVDNCKQLMFLWAEFAHNLWRKNKAVDNLRYISWQIIPPSPDTPSGPRSPAISPDKPSAPKSPAISPDTPRAPRSSTISGYSGSDINADDHDTLETNLEVHYFYHKPNSIIYYAIMTVPC